MKLAHGDGTFGDTYGGTAQRYGTVGGSRTQGAGMGETSDLTRLRRAAAAARAAVAAAEGRREAGGDDAPSPQRRCRAAPATSPNSTITMGGAEVAP
eukprot:gene1663-7386_t